MYMLVFWVVFGEFLKLWTDNAFLFLMSGLVVWQWFGSTVSHGSTTIMQNQSIFYTTPVPPLVFPLSTILTDIFKFVFILGIYIAAVFIFIEDPYFDIFYLMFILMTELSLICAVTVWFALLIPIFPDLRYVIDSVLNAMLFLSGVFFKVDAIPDYAKEYFYANPMAVIVHDFRLLTVEGISPDPARLLTIFGISGLAIIVGAIVMQRMRWLYPKLPE
jgi:lipopolysaccharide transport system permease protein